MQVNLKCVKRQWVSIVSLLLSIIAVCFTYFRCKPIEANWVGILVGVLAVLVTVLIGWNIYTVIDVKQTIAKAEIAAEEILKKSTDFKEKTTNEIDKLRKDLLALISDNLAENAYIQGIMLASFIPHSYMRHIEAFVRSLVYLLQDFEFKDKTELCNNIDEYLEQIKISIENRKNDKECNDDIKYKKEFVDNMEKIMASNCPSFSSQQKSKFAIMQRDILKIFNRE